MAATPDLTLAFGTAGVSAVVALLWASAYQLLVSLGPSQLRYASVQSAFHGLLRIMDFPARSPLRLQMGPVWIGVVAAIGLGVGVVFTWPATSGARTGAGRPRPPASEMPGSPTTT